jgi:toxin ParE1/3/4
VPQLRISAEAENDIDEIVAYSIANWGPEQAERYLGKLEEGLNRLLVNPRLGRSCNAIHSGLRRFEIERHVAFFISEPEVVLIVRVLHQSMLPSRYL